eukprot:GEMP01009999.1.p1 GENE.GEMP01009999.1~~GEMP01009999.1.p1  ORF type:complete len:486 (+),score=77.57 GEMP01009999.1:115-1572(+)
MVDLKAEDECSFESVEVKKSEEKGAGILGGSFNLSNAALGAGILTFPDQFARLTIGAGTVLQILFIALVIFGLIVHGQTAKLTVSDSLPMAARRLFGKNVERVAIVLLIVYCWFTTLAYLVAIGSSLESFGEALRGKMASDAADAPWYWDRRFTTSVLSIVFVYPLSLLRNMSALSWSSSIAIMSVCYITIFVLVSAIVYNDDVGDRDDTAGVCDPMEWRAIPTPTFWGIVPAISSMLFGYQCHLSSYCNYGSLTTKAKSAYPYITLIGSLVCFFTYTTVGISGAYLFGGCTHTWVLNNYAVNDTAANVARALIAVAVAFSYPILAFTGRREILRLFDTLSAARNWEFSENNIFVGTVNRRFFWVSSIYFFTNLVAALFISLESAIQLVGTSAAAWMFIYPGLFAMKLSYLTHEGTIDEALSQLPDSPHEELVDSWVNGIRNRVTWWLSGWQRIALWWSGLIFAVIGFLLLVIGFTQFVRDMAGY